MARTARSAAWRPASRRSGTPCWRSSRSPTPACRPIIPPWPGPPRGCWLRRSPGPGTGRCARPASPPAALRSQSTTTAHPTSSTPPPSADVTAHVVEGLAAEGLAGSRAVRRGVVWLLRAQESDGSWFGRWGANYVYGTGAVVPALIAAGVKPGKPAIRRAIGWLEAHQNPDGGWGEDLRSYDDPGLAGRGASTASQTAWARLALLAAGPPRPAAHAGIRRLADHPRPGGTWDEPEFTGTGFPGDFYINYHLYRLVFPLHALGRYLSGQGGAS